MKKLSTLLTAAALILISSTGCTKTESPSDRYFRFKANGVQYDYQYNINSDFFNSGTSNMGAFQSTTTAWGGTYQIYGYSRVDPTARGEVRFFLNKEDFNTKDTIILDGVRNRVAVSYLKYGGEVKDYLLAEPLVGKIIFLIKDAGFLKAKFDFPAGDADGSILQFTEGAFQVGRLN